jgi:hypothetical protein
LGELCLICDHLRKSDRTCACSLSQSPNIAITQSGRHAHKHGFNEQQTDITSITTVSNNNRQVDPGRNSNMSSHMLARERERLQAQPKTAKRPKQFLRFEQHVPARSDVMPLSHATDFTLATDKIATTLIRKRTHTHPTSHLNLKGLSDPALSLRILWSRATIYAG